MKTLRNWLFVLIVAMSVLASPVLVSANSGAEQVTPAPDCKVDPDACQAMLAQYQQLYGPLPSPTPTPEPSSATIEMTGGENPPQDVVTKMHEFEGELRGKALTFCSDKIWVDLYMYSVAQDQLSPQQAVEMYSAYTDTEMNYLGVYDEYASFLKQQAEAGFNVPSRPPTMWELVQQLPGCTEGNYQPGK